MKDQEQEKGKLAPLLKRVAKTPSTIVYETIRHDGRRFSAEWLAEDTGHGAQAFLYDGNVCVCEISFFNTNQSRSVGQAIVKQALVGLVSRKGKEIRKRLNRKVREAAAEKKEVA